MAKLTENLGGGYKALSASEYRRMVSLAAAKANKRVQRLVKNGLTDSPAYQALIEKGEPKFGVKGKTYNQVQAEFARINRFLSSETSTIRGIDRTFKTIANNTGLRVDSPKALRDKSKIFFELANKVEEYIRQVNDSASALGYHRIWELVSEEMNDDESELNSAEEILHNLIDKIDSLIDYKPVEQFGDWVVLKKD